MLISTFVELLRGILVDSPNHPTNCPHCNISLLGDPIPQEYIDKGYYSGTHWKREIGIEDPSKYDGVYYYQCPDCNAQWGGYRSLKETNE